MPSNRLHIVPGVVSSFDIDLTDLDGEALPADRLVGLVVKVRVRLTPAGSDVLLFQSPDAARIAVNPAASLVTVTFLIADAAVLMVGTAYFWQLEVTFADGEVKTPIEWTPVDVDLGGSAAVAVPPFAATVKLDHDYPMSDDMRYMTPGGSPIESAQIRIYDKATYDAGLLDAPLGISMTNAYGRWVQPVLVPPGYTYVVRFDKTYEYGPDLKIVVGV